MKDKKKILVIANENLGDFYLETKSNIDFKVKRQKVSIKKGVNYIVVHHSFVKEVLKGLEGYAEEGKIHKVSVL